MEVDQGDQSYVEGPVDGRQGGGRVNLFLLKSPLQAINALEARHHLHIQSGQARALLLPGASSNTQDQMTSVLSTMPWKEARAVRLSAQPSALRLMRTKRLVEQFVRSAGPSPRLIIGDYRAEIMRHAIWCAEDAEVLVLDDGAATLEIWRRRAQLAAGIDESRLGWKDALKRYLLGVRMEHPERVTFFTSYALQSVSPRDQVIHNEYAFIRSLAATRAPTDWVLLLGSPLIEVDGFTNELYRGLVAQVASQYGPSQVRYVPHRRERVEQLATLESIPNLQILTINEPIEWYLGHSRERPAVLAGFFSSALLNCARIFGNTQSVHAFRLPSALFSDARRAHVVEDVYRHMEEHGGSHLTVRWPH